MWRALNRHVSWAMDAEDNADRLYRRIWRNIAYAIRYGKGTTIAEVAALDVLDLRTLLEELNEIVKQENPDPKR